MPRVVTQDGKSTLFELQATVPATDKDYNLPLPAGTYHISLAVDSDVTGATSSLAMRPIVSPAGQVGNVDIRMLEPDDATPIASLALTAADEGRIATITRAPTGVPMDDILPLPHGLQISFTKGAAVTGEKCRVVLLATKVG